MFMTIFVLRLWRCLNFHKFNFLLIACSSLHIITLFKDLYVFQTKIMAAGVIHLTCTNILSSNDMNQVIIKHVLGVRKLSATIIFSQIHVQYSSYCCCKVIPVFLDIIAAHRTYSYKKRLACAHMYID